MLSYEVKSDKYSTVRELLKNEFMISNRLLVKLKKESRIFVNNKNQYVDYKLSIGDIVKVDMDFEEKSDNIVPNDKININIVYEDDYLIILNKDSNTPIHPSHNHYTDSLSNGLKAYYVKNGIKKKIRPVTRLDKDTSGLVVFAKSEYIQECLIKQMKGNSFKKKYIAILTGKLDKEFGIIEANIARKNDSIIEREVSTLGDYAKSEYKVIKYDEKNNITYVEFTLHTGRTHQIRVHSRFIGHPILGDSLYGQKSNLISRQALHAYSISFIHPITHKKLEFKLDLPKDMNI
ncbi:MAG: RluA family pseudouridine synthase [Clostridia bacterium]|nr:RluA family pseudouridine synthase [Clostridia bacterium]